MHFFAAASTASEPPAPGQYNPAFAPDAAAGTGEIDLTAGSGGPAVLVARKGLGELHSHEKTESLCTIQHLQARA